MPLSQSFPAIQMAIKLGKYFLYNKTNIKSTLKFKRTARFGNEKENYAHREVVSMARAQMFFGINSHNFSVCVFVVYAYKFRSLSSTAKLRTEHFDLGSAVIV